MARHSHFTRAARDLGLAQPALSQQIAQLEEELGVAVFERSRRGARLTAAGESLVQRAERILRDVDDARREAGRYSSLDHGRVAIGTISSIAVLRLPTLLARFRARYPGVEVQVHEGHSARLVELLGSGMLDLALLHTASLGTGGGAPPPGRRGEHIAWESAYSEELVLVVGRRHRLAHVREVRWVDLSEESFIMFHEGSMLRTIIASAAAAAGVTIRTAFEVSETATLRSFVSTGLGVSVLSRSTADAPGPPVQRVRLTAPRLVRTVRLGWRRQAEANPAAVALMEFVRSQLVHIRRSPLLAGLIAVLVLSSAVHAQKPRERDLKLPIGGTAGPLDAITDVAGVEVGHTTLNTGSGTLVVGKGPVRTGVTVVHPRGKANSDPVFAAWFTLNGNGEMTGTTWVQESGLLEGPVAITNTHSVGVVRDAIIQWELAQKNALQPWWLPVVAETYDGGLNDINGFHVKPPHVLAALDGAAGGVPQEGAVGGGTGMVCHGFKGGIGTASRTLPADQGGYTVGVLVQCNYGARRDLRIAGVPVGEEISDLAPCIANNAPLPPDSARRHCDGDPRSRDNAPEQGSIIVVVATDAPLLPHQLKRIATRVSLGIGRQGGFGGNSSGDIFIAFSTANPRAWFDDQPVKDVKMLPNDRITPLFQATAQATEAAITNALLAAETTTGANDLRVYAMPVDRMLAAMRKYGRLP